MNFNLFPLKVVHIYFKAHTQARGSEIIGLVSQGPEATKSPEIINQSLREAQSVNEQEAQQTRNQILNRWNDVGIMWN